MSDTPPDHLAINPASPHHDAQALERGVGVRFNDVERTDVEEYSVSEGWIRVQAGKARDRRGNPMTLKIKGSVEVRYREGIGPHSLCRDSSRSRLRINLRDISSEISPRRVSRNSSSRSAVSPAPRSWR